MYHRRQKRIKIKKELTDISTIPHHMRMDYITRNKNIAAGHKLCFRCSGTGNELYSMYRECENCRGTGIALLTTNKAGDTK